MNLSGGSSTCNVLRSQRGDSRSRSRLRRNAGNQLVSGRRPGENPGHLTSESTAPFLSGGRSVSRVSLQPKKAGAFRSVSGVDRPRWQKVGSSPARCISVDAYRPACRGSGVTGESARAGARPAFLKRGECRLVRRWAHNPVHVGSSPTPATSYEPDEWFLPTTGAGRRYNCGARYLFWEYVGVWVCEYVSQKTRKDRDNEWIGIIQWFGSDRAEAA